MVADKGFLTMVGIHSIFFLYGSQNHNDTLVKNSREFQYMNFYITKAIGINIRTLIPKPPPKKEAKKPVYWQKEFHLRGLIESVNRN